MNSLLIYSYKRTLYTVTVCSFDKSSYQFLYEVCTYQDSIYTRAQPTYFLYDIKQRLSLHMLSLENGNKFVKLEELKFKSRLQSRLFGVSEQFPRDLKHESSVTYCFQYHAIYADETSILSNKTNIADMLFQSNCIQLSQRQT